MSYTFLEGDFEVIINSLKSNDESFTSYGNLINEEKSLLNSFAIFCCSHTIDKEIL